MRRPETTKNSHRIIKCSAFKNPDVVYSCCKPAGGQLQELTQPEAGYALTLNSVVRKQPIKYCVKNAKVLGQSRIILNEKSNFSVENIVFKTSVDDKIMHSGDIESFD